MALFLLVLAAAGPHFARAGAALSCAGDCDANGRTTGTEITRVVQILGGTIDPTACPAADPDGSGRVTGTDVTRAVIALGLGPACRAATPTPTLSSSPSVTPTAPGGCPQTDIGTSLRATVSGSTESGLDAFSATCGGGGAPDSTFLFTTPITGVYVIDTAGSGFDTVLSARAGGCLGAELACDDDISGLTAQSRVSVALETGEQVVILVDAADQEEGDFALHLERGPALPLSDIAPGPPSSSPSDLTAVGEALFFVANDEADTGQELWRSDGTAAGTVLVRDIFPGPQGSFPTALTEVGGSLFFGADDGSHGSELWTSDGTAEGTALVMDIAPGPTSSFRFSLASLNDVFFFAADDGVAGTELWRSRGAAEDAVLVKDVAPGPQGGVSFETSTSFAGALFFAADDGATGMELWRTDGTNDGTMLVRDIAAGPAGSLGFDASFTAAGGVLFFVADDGIHGAELWRSNGTQEGTAMVADIFPGSDSSFPAGLTDVDGTLFFGADDGVTGFELWKTEGTMDGAVQVADTFPGPEGGLFFADIARPQSLGGILLFAASDRAEPPEVWKSDGTAEGTRLVKDVIDNTLAPVAPQNFATIDGALLFSTFGSRGFEPWRSDGTEDGTLQLQDIALCEESSFPDSFTVAGSTVFFTANDGKRGEELWGMPRAALTLVEASPERFVDPTCPDERRERIAIQEYVSLNNTLYCLLSYDPGDFQSARGGAGVQVTSLAIAPSGVLQLNEALAPPDSVLTSVTGTANNNLACLADIRRTDFLLTASSSPPFLTFDPEARGGSGELSGFFETPSDPFTATTRTITFTGTDTVASRPISSSEPGPPAAAKLRVFRAFGATGNRPRLDTFVFPNPAGDPVPSLGSNCSVGPPGPGANLTPCDPLEENPPCGLVPPQCPNEGGSVAGQNVTLDARVGGLVGNRESIDDVDGFFLSTTTTRRTTSIVVMARAPLGSPPLGCSAAGFLLSLDRKVIDAIGSE